MLVGLLLVQIFLGILFILVLLQLGIAIGKKEEKGKLVVQLVQVLIFGFFFYISLQL